MTPTLLAHAPTPWPLPLAWPRRASCEVPSRSSNPKANPKPSGIVNTGNRLKPEITTHMHVCTCRLARWPTCIILYAPPRSLQYSNYTLQCIKLNKYATRYTVHTVYSVHTVHKLIRVKVLTTVPVFIMPLHTAPATPLLYSVVRKPERLGASLPQRTERSGLRLSGNQRSGSAAPPHQACCTFAQ